MRQSDHEQVVLRLDRHHTGVLRRLHRVTRDDPAEQSDRERFTQGQQIDHRANLGRQLVEMGDHHVRQHRWHLHIARQPPRATGASKSAGRDELPQIQHIALAELPQPLDRPLIDVPAEYRGHQRFGFPLRQGLKFQSLEMLVFPQRGHRIGYGFAAAHRRHQRRPPLQHKLIHQQSRQIVEQVRIVDRDHGRPAPADDPIHGPAHDGLRITRLGHQTRERAQRHRPRALGRTHPAHERTAAAFQRNSFPGEPGLTDPGATRQHHPACAPTSAHRGLDERQLLRATGQRPRPHRAHRCPVDGHFDCTQPG